MPTVLPARDPFRRLSPQAMRRDRPNLIFLLLMSALVTLGVGAVSHRTNFAIGAFARGDL